MSKKNKDKNKRGRSGSGQGRQQKGQPTPKRNAGQAQYQRYMMSERMQSQLRESLQLLRERGLNPAPPNAPTPAPLVPPVSLDEFNAAMRAGEYQRALDVLNRKDAGAKNQAEASLIEKLARNDFAAEHHVVAQLLAPHVAAQLDVADLNALLKRFRYSMDIFTVKRGPDKAAVAIALLPLLEQQSNDEGLELALDIIVSYYTMKEQPRLALPYQERSLQLAERRGKQNELICAHMELARLYIQLRQPTAATEHQAIIDQMYTDADPNGKLELLNDIISCSGIWANGAWEQSYRDRILEVAPQADINRLSIDALEWVAGDYQEAERYAEALPYYERLVELYVAGDEDRSNRLNDTLNELAYTYEKLGRDEDALQALQRMLPFTSGHESNEWLIYSLKTIIKLGERLGRAQAELQPYRDQLVKLGHDPHPTFDDEDDDDDDDDEDWASSLTRR